MSYKLIKVEKKDHLTVITINRPEVMNAMSPPTSAEMSRAFDEFSDDPDQWVCILTGAGDRAFSAGNDLKYQAKHGPGKVIEEMVKVKGGQGGICRRYDCFKPIIAAVNGLVLGGGFEVALACDIIIVAENAQFAGVQGFDRISNLGPCCMSIDVIDLVRLNSGVCQRHLHAPHTAFSRRCCHLVAVGVGGIADHLGTNVRTSPYRLVEVLQHQEARAD